MAPADIDRLNHVMVDGAQQYFDWVKGQTFHRQQLELKALESQVTTERRGQLFGLIIALTFGTAAFVLGLRGNAENLAIAFVSAPLVALVGVFVTGRLITRSENIAKTKILAGRTTDQDKET